MEQRFLHLIEYNVAISRQLYTRIYFELRLCGEGWLPLKAALGVELDTRGGLVDEGGRLIA